MDGAQSPPRMYMEPPAFDIQLQDFEMLPLLRLEAYTLLHSSRARPATNTVIPEEVTAASLLLHSHADGDSPGAIRHRHADVSSHFVLRLACCGRGSTRSTNNTDGSSHGSHDGTHVGRRQGPGGGDEGDRENEYERVRNRREWFVRAEKDMFKARLQWYLRGRGDDDDCSGGSSGGGGEKANIGDVHKGVAAGFDEQGLAAQRQHPVVSHRQQAVSRPKKMVHSRLEALRLVYGLGWLQPVRSIGDLERLRTTTDRDTGRVKRRKETDSGQTDHPSESTSDSILISSCGESDAVFTSASASASGLDPGSGCGHDGFQYYTCPFEKALSLVRKRQVVLKGGAAIVSPEQVPSVLLAHFDNVLRNNLRVTARGLPMVEEDERVRQMLGQVRKAVDSFLLPAHAINSSSSNRHRSAVTINRDNLDAVANRHFPLCMRRIVQVLRREHHLKYQARLQLISFLLNAGMEVGELLAVWRDEFPKGMPKEEYARKSKGYEYSLRHLYGLEGKRRAFKPMSCSRIAASGYGSGEGGLAHGCPFTATRSHDPQLPRVNSHYDHDGTVRGMLAHQLHLPPADIEDIIRPPSAAGRGDGNSSALAACRRHFDVVHSSRRAGGGEGEAGTLLRGVGQEASPNGWLAASTRVNAPGESESRGAAVANPARLPWMRQEKG